MNNATFEQAQHAYENQDYVNALEMYNSVFNDGNFPLQPGEYGLVYHQIGNCYVKLANYSEAISSYINATGDESYISLGTVYYNLGMAYAYMNDFGKAIENFNVSINHPNYRSKFKAYTAMGNALMKSGKSADAASAFRSAAMDERNPDPTRALLNLGVCFMALDRPQDAVTVYLSTFQYNMSSDFKNRLNANLGQAYVACGQMQRAVEAFEDSLRDKSYKLSDSASVDYQRAIASISKGNGEINPNLAGPAAAAAAGMAVGSLESQQASAQEPNPDEAFAQDGPFEQNLQNSVPMQDNGIVQNVNNNDDQFEKWTESTKDAAYTSETKKNPAKVILAAFLFLIAGLIIAGSILYCLGFGFPSQEMVCKDFFSNPIAAKDTCFASDLTDVQKQAFCSMASTDTSAKVECVQRSVNESVAYVKAKTNAGKEVTYKIKMTRELLGWKIVSVDLSFASSDN